MWFANFIAGFILLIFGLIIRFLKAVDLIAGINAATMEERAKYDEEALSKFVGNMLICAAFILFAGGAVSIILGLPDYIAGASWVMFVLIILSGVIYMNTGNRFKKKLI
jgi:hypothetical protein